MKKMVRFAVVMIGVLSSISFGATYGGGAGTADDPYQIWTAEQMNTIGANSGDWGACFKLMADIDMSAAGTYPVIGYGTPFTGIFDGNGYVIRNLTYTSMNASYPVGLFGKTSLATIKNLGVENINLNVVFNNGWWSYNCVGGLVGNQEQGAIINCYSTGTVSSSNTTYESYSYSCSGGLTGYQTSGTMVNCYSTATVSSFSRTYEVYSYSWAGGLVGVQENGTIDNCYSTGSVTSDSIAPPSGDSSSASFSDAGGLAAIHHASIQKCYSTGQVSATGRYINKGGLIGYSYATPTACFWDTQTSGMTTSAGGSGVQGKTTAEMQALSTFTNAGWDFTNETANGTNDIWRMCVDGVDYPRLNWESIGGDLQCPNGVSTEDLDYFVGRWLLDNCTSSNNYCGGADIDISGKVNLEDWAIFAQYWMEM